MGLAQYGLDFVGSFNDISFGSYHIILKHSYHFKTKSSLTHFAFNPKHNTMKKFKSRDLTHMNHMICH